MRFLPIKYRAALRCSAMVVYSEKEDTEFGRITAPKFALELGMLIRGG